MNEMNELSIFFEILKEEPFRELNIDDLVTGSMKEEEVGFKTPPKMLYYTVFCQKLKEILLERGIEFYFLKNNIFIMIHDDKIYPFDKKGWTIGLRELVNELFEFCYLTRSDMFIKGCYSQSKHTFVY